MGQGRICKINGCGNPVVARGWCEKHYTRWKRYGDPHFRKVAANGECLEWLFANCDRDTDDCIIWPYSGTSHGYATVAYGGKTMSAARVVCEHIHGPPPTPLHEAAHSCGCGHKGCVNARHLRWLTPAENTAEKYAHGTILFDQDNHMTRLSNEQVKEIRASSEHFRSIAGRLGMSAEHIRKIKTGKARTHAV